MDPANATQYIPPSAIWMWIFPVTYLIHLAEEYWGGEGYPAYLYRLRGVHLSTARFFFFQILGIVLIVIGIFVSLHLRWPRFFLAIVGALVLSNGITHTVTALRHGGYGPGLVTCVLVWIPLGIVTLCLLFGEMPTSRLLVAASIGVAIQATVALIAMRGGKLV
jgi:Protein of unknown function with HXXEE motif